MNLFSIVFITSMNKNLTLNKNSIDTFMLQFGFKFYDASLKYANFI